MYFTIEILWKKLRCCEHMTNASALFPGMQTLLDKQNKNVKFRIGMIVLDWILRFNICLNKLFLNEHRN